MSDEETTHSDEQYSTHQDRTYARIAVDSETDTEAALDRIADLAERSQLRAGIVLCCPANRAAIVQSIADTLDTPTEAETAFEKVTAEVTGTDPDSLQFRLYLAPSERVPSKTGRLDG